MIFDCRLKINTKTNLQSAIGNGFLLHEAADILLRRAAYRETINFDSWNSYSDRNCLTVLAAGAYALVEFQVIAHHGDSSQHVGAVAD